MDETNAKGYGAGREAGPALLVGCLCILAGLAAKTVIARCLTPDGEISNTLVKLIIRAGQLTLIAAGLFFVLRRPRFTYGHLLLAALGFLAPAVLAEIGLQLFFTPPQAVCGWRGEVNDMPPNERNEFGYRGQTIEYGPDESVVVLLGDSQIEAISWPLGLMPEQLLENHLRALGKRVKVFTLGAGGYGQDQQLPALEEFSAKHRVDLVCLWFSPLNDTWNNMFPTHWPADGAPKPTFWVEEGRLLGPNVKMGEELGPMPVSRIRLWALYQLFFAHPGYPAGSDAAWEKRLPSAYVPLARPEGKIRRDWQEEWDAGDAHMLHENLATEKSHMAIWLAPRSPRMEYALDLTRRLLGKIDRLAESKGARLCLFRTTNPARDHEGIYELNGKYYRASRAQYDANLAEIDRGFRAFPIAVTVEDWRTSESDSHLNPKANDQVMRDLAAAIADLLPPRRATP